MSNDDHAAQRDDFKQFRRKQIAELADWTPGFDMAGVSVSDADKAAGSPKAGDKVARNPTNHSDRWLVAADYFATNFESIAAPQSPPAGGWVSVPREVFDAVVALVPLLEDGWDEYDTEDDQNEGAKACDRLINAVKAMTAAPTEAGGKEGKQ